MTGKNLEIISQIVLWYENSFRIDCSLFQFFTNLQIVQNISPNTKKTPVFLAR